MEGDTRLLGVVLREAFTTAVAGVGLLRELGMQGFVGACYIAVATEATHQDEALGLLRETAECVGAVGAYARR